MSFNFGAFAGGLSEGFDRGQRVGKSIRDVIRERRLEDLRTQGLEEARSARAQALNGMISERAPGASIATPAEQPAAAAQPDVATTSPVIDRSVEARPLDEAPSPAPVATQPASPATAGLPPSISTQTPPSEPAAATPADTTPRAITPQASGLPQPAAIDPAPVSAAPAPASAPSAAAPEGNFFVNGRGYATREEAYKAADSAAPATMDFFMKNAVPKLQEEYIAQGDPAKAEAWGQWAAQKKNQAAMREWSSMYRAAQFGDMEKAADHAFNLYKQYDDGVTPLSKETVKNKDGEVTGFNVRLKNDATGEVVSQFIDRKAMVEMGLSALAPDKMFEVTFQRQTAADKQAADARVKATHDAAVAARDVAKQKAIDDRADSRDQERAKREEANIRLRAELDAKKLGEKPRAEAEAKVQLLRESGYTDEQIAKMVPAIVGAGDHKKTTDATERRALITSDLVKNDPTFARLPQAERAKRVDEMMSVIYGDETKPAKPAAAASPSTPSAPQYVRDRQTGEIFKLENGKRVPTGKKMPVGQPPGES